jgi:hypothetical protein
MVGSLRAASLVLIGAFDGAALAEPIAASRGSWSGAIGERTSGWPAGATRVELRVDGSDKEFSVALSGPGGALLDASFVAGSRKDVFDPPAERGGLMALMFGSAAPNPLEGKPLGWARRTTDELVVYRLEVQDGPFRLDRVAIKPIGDRVELTVERREHDRAPETFSATLQRQKP